jgi:hypothetical protein
MDPSLYGGGHLAELGVKVVEQPAELEAGEALARAPGLPRLCCDADPNVLRRAHSKDF